MHRCISINNYAAGKWLLQPFLADLIDFDNASPGKLQSPENMKILISKSDFLSLKEELVKCPGKRKDMTQILSRSLSRKLLYAIYVIYRFLRTLRMNISV